MALTSPNDKTSSLKRTNSRTPVRGKSPSRPSTKNRTSLSPMRGSSMKDVRGKSPPRNSKLSSPNHASVDSSSSALPGMVLLKELGIHKGAVTSLVTMTTKKEGEVLVLSSGVDTLVKVWNMESYTLKQTLRGHTDRLV